MANCGECLTTLAAASSTLGQTRESAASGEVSITLWEDAMAGENFCAESLERRRRDVAFARNILNRRIDDAVRSAEDAELEQMYELLYKAQQTIDTMRSDLEDLVLERERQMDAEDEQCGA